MPNFRVMSPCKPGSPIATPSGTNYAQVPGTVLDVPSQHADILASNGWTVIGQSGATSARPGPLTPGLYMAQQGDRHFDTSLTKLIVFDGLVWRDPATGNAV